METFIEIWPTLTWVFTAIIAILIPFIIFIPNHQIVKVLSWIQFILLAIQLVCLIIFFIYYK